MSEEDLETTHAAAATEQEAEQPGASLVAEPDVDVRSHLFRSGSCFVRLLQGLRQGDINV